LPAPPGRGIGRPAKLLRRGEQHQPISVKAVTSVKLVEIREWR
jgi:hypothetical protein